MIEINEKDLYQFLITECRYGYTRNNHLMPSGSYQHVKEYLPLMAKQDKEYAVSTAKQLCEECISDQIMINFYDGYDDQLGNRKEAFDFVEEMIDFVNQIDTSQDWRPYNYESYLANKAKDYDPRYSIYEDSYESLSDELREDFPERIRSLKLISPNKISKHELYSYLFGNVLGLKEGDSIQYRKWYVDMYNTTTTKYVFDSLKRVFYVTSLDTENKKED